jgi:hypothetical protein
MCGKSELTGWFDCFAVITGAHTRLTLIMAVWVHLDIDTAVEMNFSDPRGQLYS